MTEPDTGDVPIVDEQPPDAQPPYGQPPDERMRPKPRRRLRVLPALAIAAMLVAGGLLMAVGGMARIVEPAPPTPVPTVGTPAPSTSPRPAKLPVTPTLDPSASPFG